MPSLFDAAVRAAMQSRLRQLTPDTKAKWGQFTAPAMLSHLIVSFETAFAEHPADAKQSFLNTPLGRWLVIDSCMPWQKNLPTSPQMLQRTPGDFAADRECVLAYLERYGRGANQTFGVHPAFGALSPRQWAKLNGKHLNHHLKQFGV